MAANHATEGNPIDTVPRNTILVGDAVEQLQELPAASIDMAMTSPPYWGLRDYGHADQLGLEPTADQYIKNLTAVFQQVKRVLKPTGTFYLNIDDTYQNKGLTLLPERITQAMVDDGWTLRNKIVWQKRDPMPESVKDRFSTTWESIYMFTKNKQYYFDLDAVREPYADSSIQRVQQNDSNPKWNSDAQRDHPDSAEETLNPDQFVHPGGKNPGDVWELATARCPDAHFAVYPRDLCQKPIKASCPPRVCARCGTPYTRDVDYDSVGGTDRRKPKNRPDNARPQRERCGYTTVDYNGWDQQCACDTATTQPGIVLDPFIGSGTTAIVARHHGRDYLGIELNEEYADLSQDRISNEVADHKLTEFTD